MSHFNLCLTSFKLGPQLVYNSRNRLNVRSFSIGDSILSRHFIKLLSYVLAHLLLIMMRHNFPLALLQFLLLYVQIVILTGNIFQHLVLLLWDTTISIFDWNSVTESVKVQTHDRYYCCMSLDITMSLASCSFSRSF